MHAALLAALPAYTALLVLASRHHWAHRCAECGWKHRQPHLTGRHRGDRLALPPNTDPEATTPTLPVLSRHPRARWTVEAGSYR